MNITPLQLSRLETIISLKTIVYLLETCRPLLSDFEKELTADCVISLAANMVKSQDDHITILLSSDSKDAVTEQHELTELYAVINAAHSLKHGVRASLNSERSKKRQPLTSRDMSVRNGLKPPIHPADTPHLPACHSDRESD